MAAPITKCPRCRVDVLNSALDDPNRCSEVCPLHPKNRNQSTVPLGGAGGDHPDDRNHAPDVSGREPFLEGARS